MDNKAIKKLEADLWEAADLLRQGSKLTSQQYCIRNAVSLGGDCDTLTCIAGSMAEAFYGVPDSLIAECRKRLPEDMLAVIDRFNQIRSE